MKKVFFFIVLYASLFISTGCKKDSVDPTTYDKEILDAINSYRTGMGLMPFEHSDFIWQIANQHSTAMADGSVPFSHDGFTERSELIRDEYGLGATAENIAWGQGSATELLNSWLGSTGHKANIEGDFELTGLSAVHAKDGNWYYTQIFYKKN